MTRPIESHEPFPRLVAVTGKQVAITGAARGPRLLV
jgi:hypothetical protein